MEKNVIIILIAAAIVLIGVIYSLIRNNAIKKNGTETEAVVSRITDDTTVNEDGTTDTRYTYFVRFRTPEGKELEVQLGGATNRLGAFRIVLFDRRGSYKAIVEQRDVGAARCLHFCVKSDKTPFRDHDKLIVERHDWRRFPLPELPTILNDESSQRRRRLFLAAHNRSRFVGAVSRVKFADDRL